MAPCLSPVCTFQLPTYIILFNSHCFSGYKRDHQNSIIERLTYEMKSSEISLVSEHRGWVDLGSETSHSTTEIFPTESLTKEISRIKIFLIETLPIKTLTMRTLPNVKMVSYQHRVFTERGRERIL